MYHIGSSSAPAEFKVSPSGTQPAHIAFGPDGNIWFTEHQTSQVATMNPSTHAVTPIALGVGSGPIGITSRPDGTIWLAEPNTGKIGTITSTHIVVTSLPPTNIELGKSFGLTVAVEYDSGGVAGGYDGIVSLAGSTAGALAGTTSVTAVHGIASFTGLSLIEPGTISLAVTSGSVTPQTIAPITVTAAAPPVVRSEQLVLAGKGKNQYVAAIVITFSTALDAATAQNTANYTVTQTARGIRAKAAKALRVRATYNAASHSVRLTLLGKPHFAAGGQLLVSAANPSGISSPDGLHLQGNIGGYAGANGLYTSLPNGRGIRN
jgi:hypothetical protein